MAARPNWKVLTAGAALAGLGIAGTGMAFADSSEAGPDVRPIEVSTADRPAADDANGGPAADRSAPDHDLDSPDGSPDSPDTTDDVDSPDGPDTPDTDSPDDVDSPDDPDSPDTPDN